jgi:DDE superfamily endonuclease
LFPTILLLCGNVNFANLSRYGGLSEKTYGRQYSQSFGFISFHADLIAEAMPVSADQIGAMDCSFIPKSGKATYGLDWFYNGSASRAEKGLEISVIAIIDVKTHRSYSLSVQQTPARLCPAKCADKRESNAPAPESSSESSSETPIAHSAIEQARTMLCQLPPKAEPELSRIDHYLHHLQTTHPHLPAGLKYWVVDGFYSKKKFVDGVVALKLHLIGKLRRDADLRYLYNGQQKARGAKRQYDGKVELSDLSRWAFVKSLEPQIDLYSAVVWHVSLKRQIRLACLVDTRKPDKIGQVLFFSSDIELDAEQMVQAYKARFQIEFIFRDAKQFTGLCDAQTRDPKRLDFHFNASLSALNLAKYETQCRSPQHETQSQPIPFSMSSYKRLAFNDHLLSRFISMLDLDPTLIKSHPNYPNLLSYGLIAP